MMKKKAFTLQEVLITIGIIGVVAAMTIPAIIGMKPDETKVKYMKAYNALTTITNELLEDPALYYTTYDANGNANCTGIYCQNLPLIAPYNANVNYSGNTKYPMLIASRLHLQGNPTVVGNNSQGGSVSFTTMDNVFWNFEIEDIQDLNAMGGGYFQTNLTINVNPNDNVASHNCIYSAFCTEPNQFLFRIGNDGKISAGDALGRAFLQNPTNMNSRNEDRAKAENLLKNADKDSQSDTHKNDDQTKNTDLQIEPGLNPRDMDLTIDNHNKLDKNLDSPITPSRF